MDDKILTERRLNYLYGGIEHDRQTMERLA